MGRLVLVNSVLMSIHTYWAQITILPRKLLKVVEAVCRSFLWKGKVDGGPGLVAWHDICASKKVGGLGIRSIGVWNTVAIGKYVWDIAKKKDNLFVKWVHSVYLTDCDWWEYQIHGDVSWYWRKIVMVKELIKAKMDLQQFVVTEYKINQWCIRLFTEQKQSVSWCSSVWNRLSVPKHRIILWLAILDRLHTKDRLWKMQIVQTKNCLLCTDE